jgi:hypothetical protein
MQAYCHLFEEQYWSPKVAGECELGRQALYTPLGVTSRIRIFQYQYTTLNSSDRIMSLAMSYTESSLLGSWWASGKIPKNSCTAQGLPGELTLDGPPARQGTNTACERGRRRCSRAIGWAAPAPR